MPNYRLNIKFDHEDLTTLYDSGEQVILVKHTSADEGKNANHVAWVSFKPFEKNTVDWSTKFAVYASNSKLENGATIHKLSDKEAATQVNYQFDKGTFITADADCSIGPNTYAVTNNMTDTKSLTFGLAQSVNVNGEAFANHPINAILVPRGQKADMTPIERVDVYLKSRIDNGTVVSNIGSISLPVEYSGEAVEHTIAYDGMTGKFYPVN